MAGLIDNMFDTTKTQANPFAGPAVSTAKSFGYDPKIGTVNLDTDTVSGQLKSILSQDNPYVTRARTSAAQYSNSRGLINTTMGAQAGETAAIDAALPIATTDAGTFSTQRLANQQYGNEALKFSADAANVEGRFNAGELNKFGLIGTQTGSEKELITARTAGSAQLSAQEAAQQEVLQAKRGDIDKELQALNAASARGLSAQEAEQQRVLKAQQGDIDKQLQALNAAAAERLSAQEAAQSVTLQTLVGEQGKELSAQQAAQSQVLQDKQGEIEKQLQALKAKDQATLSAQEAAQIKSLEADKAANAQALSVLQAEQQKVLLDQQAQIDKDMQVLKSKSASELSAQEAAQLSELEKQKAETAKEIAKLQSETATAVAQINASTAGAGAAISGQYSLEIAKLNGENQRILKQIEFDNQSVLNAGGQATTIMSQAASDIFDIEQNTNMTAEQRQAAVDEVTRTANASLATIGSIANIVIPLI